MPFSSKFNPLSFVWMTCLAATFWMGGCSSTPPSTEARSTAWDVEAFAKAPRVGVAWRKQLDAPEIWDYQPQQYANPRYLPQTQTLLVGTTGGQAILIRASSAETIWRVVLDSPVHAAPAYHDGLAFFATLGGKIYALDSREAGETRWRFETEGSVETNLTVAEGRLLVTDARDSLYVLDAKTGELIWKYKRELPQYFTIKGSGTPTVDDGIVYVGFADGVLSALQLESGGVIWETDLTGGKLEFNDIDVAPVVVDDRVYASSYAKGLYALDRETGEIAWERSISTLVDVEYAEGVLYASAAQGRVVGVAAENGEVLWSFRTDRHSPVTHTVAAHYVFVSTSEGPLFVLDRQTGFPLLRSKLSAGFNTALVPAGNLSFILSNTGDLYALTLAF